MGTSRSGNAEFAKAAAIAVLTARNALLEAVVAVSNDLLQATELDATVAATVTRRIGRALRADRVVIGRRLPPDERTRLGYITFDHEWAAPGVARQTDNPALRTFDLAHYEAHLKVIERGEPVATLTEELATDAGQAEQAATGARSQFQYPIMVDGTLWGTFGVDDCHSPRVWNTEEIATLKLAATALGSLVKRGRLIQARIEAEQALSQERSRMAREIHDTLAQGFTGVIMQLHAAEDALENNDLPDLARHVALARDRARLGLAEARRSVFALRPPLLEDGDLASALRTYVARVLRGADVRTRMHFKGDARRIDPIACIELFRIAQEALSNAVLHAHARKIDLHLIIDDRGGVTLEITDDGCGMHACATHSGTDGFGLVSMRERAGRIGARFDIDSRPGAGTRIQVRRTARAAPSSAGGSPQTS